MRVVKIAAGFTVLSAGVAMLVLPGPGWLVIGAGLAILGTELEWPRRLLARFTRLLPSPLHGRGRSHEEADNAVEQDRSGRA